MATLIKQPMPVYIKTTELNLLVFTRNSNGVPQYDKGLRKLSASIECSIHFGEETENFSEELKEITRSNLEVLLFGITAEFKGAVLLDNDDAFLLNMISPHQLATFRGMFETSNMIFTPFASPNPCRLQFPFLVGKNAESLFSDMKEFYLQHLRAVLKKFSLVFGLREVNPISGVGISSGFEVYMDI